MNVQLVWFRDDLRISDNPALSAAARSGEILPIYILEPTSPQGLGAAARCWLEQSLSALQETLEGHLIFSSGNPASILSQLAKNTGSKHVYWNRGYTPYRRATDLEVEKQLKKNGIQVHTFNASLLWSLDEVKKQDGTTYKVFSPFYYKGCLRISPPRRPTKAPSMKFHAHPASYTLKQLDLSPEKSWAESMLSHWKIGEKAAQERLHDFLTQGLIGYKVQRDFPAKPHVSRLSPHLRFGEISPNQIWWEAKAIHETHNDLSHFFSELGWREFSYYLLYHYPDILEKNFNRQFDDFSWQHSPAWVEAWQKGQTGYPLVDAGMRELWQTGYMHNRVRMITASFLTKNLREHWKVGAQWFQECLVDADLANNTASWQWVAGSGADAAPYFRIFNPTAQAQKFDADGEYIRRFIPELAKLPTRYLFEPWNAPAEVCKEAHFSPGTEYPLPIVDLKTTRESALDAYQALIKKHKEK